MWNTTFPEDRVVHDITVRMYVPQEEILKAIEGVLSATINPDLGLYLPAQVQVYKLFYTFYTFTNLEITDEQRDAPMKLYDDLIFSDFWYDIYNTLLKSPSYGEFCKLLDETIAKLEKYQTSAYGILDSFKKDYDNLEFDMEKLKEKMANKEDLKLLDTVVQKLG